MLRAVAVNAFAAGFAAGACLCNVFAHPVVSATAFVCFVVTSGVAAYCWSVRQ